MRYIQFSALILLLLTGCTGARPGKPDLTVHSYTLSYPAPASETRSTDKTLAVLPFTTAPEYLERKIVYAPHPGELSTYHYHRWRVVPAELVQSFLRRDLMASELFAAVTGPDTVLEPDFILEGSVEEFLEKDGETAWSASAAVAVALIDEGEKGVVRRLMFQRIYREEEPCTARTPKEVAEAMSRAVSRISERIRKDIKEAITRRDRPRVP